MKNGCAYIRVSTDDQTEYSPGAQKRLIIEYAKKNDIIITEKDFFEDLGVSGKRSDKRDSFREMIATCKDSAHPYDVVLVWKFSRFARNQEESIVYKRLLKKNGVDVISVSEPIPEGAVGELVERIFEWMDEYYSINLSVEVKRGMTEKAMRGGYQFKVPMGYSKPKGQDIPTIDKTREPIIRKIYQLFMEESYTPLAITKYFNQQGIKSSAGGKFCARYIVSILENPFYAGKVRWGVRKEVDGRLDGYDYDNAIIADGQHEPYITWEYYQQVRRKLNGYIHDKKKIQQRTGTKHWMSGLLRCENCGHTLMYHCKQHGGRNPYYTCSGHGIGICPETQHTSVPKLEIMFKDGLNNLIEQMEIKNQEHSIEQSDLSIYETQLALIDKKEQRVKDAYLAGIDSIEEYKSNKAKLNEEKEKILSKIKSASTDEPADKKQAIHDLIGMIDSDEIPTDTKNVAFKQIFEKVVYSREKQIMQFYLK